MSNLKPEETVNASDPSGKPKKKALKIILIVLCSFLAVAIAAGIGAYAYYRHIFNQILLPDTESNTPPDSEDFETDDPWWDETDSDTDSETNIGPVNSESSQTETSEPAGSDSEEPGTFEVSETSETSKTTESTTVQTIDPDEVDWPDDLVPLGDDGLINIMLVGQDNGSFSKRGRSDSMILLSVNPKTGGIAMVSFMRDLYVQIGNGYSDNRLNVAYKFGGFPLMFDVMKRNFGITCDYGVVVNFSSFKKIIDTLGGVDLTFTQKEVTHLIEKCKVGKYPDGSEIQVGLNKNVPSDTALAYARIRKIDSDFSRTARQRKLLLSVYNSFKGASLKTILELVGQITDFIRIYGMTSNELISLVTRLYPLLGNEIKSARVPGSGEYSYASVRGMSVLIPKLDKIRESLKKTLPIEK